jgi:hypothetical protein
LATPLLLAADKTASNGRGARITIHSIEGLLNRRVARRKSRKAETAANLDEASCFLVYGGHLNSF